MLHQWWSLSGVTTTRDFVRWAGNGSPAPQENAPAIHGGAQTGTERRNRDHGK
jgi:hypothetical protein